MRLEPAADVLPIRGKREADPDGRPPRQDPQQIEVAQDQRTPRLNDEERGRTLGYGCENRTHRLPALFGRLIRIDQR